MVRESEQSEVLQAARRTVVGRPPGTAILNETEILERAAGHFRLGPQGDLDSVVGTAEGGMGQLLGPCEPDTD
ncbi:MAG: hypothetical protein ACYSU7_01660 [Planctomycetota bacterium]